MKRVTAILCLLAVLTLSACNSEPATTPDAAQMRVGALTGPTAIGMVRLMEQSEQGETENQYEFALEGAADALTPCLLQGELDLAAIPANLAAALFQNSEGEIQVLAVNTLGVLYLMEAGGETVQNISDLVGKTIYATGMGSTPEYVLRYLLLEHGIDPDADVTIEFKSEPTEVVAQLMQDGSGIAMLPQPYVIAAQKQVEGLRTALDLTEEWNLLDTGSSLVTGVMVGRRAFIEEHPDAIASFLADYEASINYAGEHVADTAALCEQYDLFTAQIAEAAIPFCNISFLSGAQMQAALGGYLEVLYEQNPQAVGGALPAAEFYYIP